MKESCREFLAQRQQTAYPDYEDIRENFFVSSEGRIFEGRGEFIEGQTTYESLTSYNNKALSVSLILSEEGMEPTENQTNALCYFVDNFLEKEDFKLYKESVLISSFNKSKDYSFNCEKNWDKRE